MGRGYLAHAVADHGVRFNAEGAAAGGEADGEGEQGGLDEVDAVECRVGLQAHDLIDDRAPAEEGAHRVVALPDRLAEHGAGVQQFPAHAARWEPCPG